MKLNTNSNTYILIYSSILVVIVAFLLAFISQSLKSTQDKNVALDKKKQILSSLNIRDIDNKTTEELYQSVIEADEIINANGDVIAAGSAGGENAGFKLNGGDYKMGKLALFICNIEGKTKYVVPVYGMGLWGGINGYIAINDDKETIFGVYFNHESETAGLGAEIKDNRKWQELFKNKNIFAKNNQKDIALSVCKKIDDPMTQVDAVSGATLTCNGVTNMLHEVLAKYMKFLEDK